MKTISFIIPVYNQEKQIKKVFETLHNARGRLSRAVTFSEIIFVDDGSEDHTFARISDTARDYPKMITTIISYKKTRGLKKAVALGKKASNANWNIVLNSDLSDLEEKLEKIAARVRRERKKPKKPLVSVVMPVYNAEKYIDAAIQSIMNQTYKNFELIIVDDQSTDKSLKIIKSYKRRYRTKIKIIRSAKNLNRGGDMCANLGIEVARGKYIARMDADDIAAPGRLATQVEFLERNPRVFLVGSNAYVINEKGKVVGEKIEPSKPADIYKSYATFHPIIHPSTMLRRIYHGKRFTYQIEYSANNDYYTFFKLICRGYIFVNLKEKLLFYRIHDKNDTFVKTKEKFLNTVKIRLLMVEKYNYKLNVRDVITSIVQAALILVLPESAIKYLYLVTKGIIQPKKITIPFFGRTISISSV